jgi:hypothetical protein
MVQVASSGGQEPQVKQQEERQKLEPLEALRVLEATQDFTEAE